MPAERPARNAIVCRQCATPLGHIWISGKGRGALGHTGRVVKLLPGVVMISVLGRTDIRCPTCGHCRSLSHHTYHSVVGNEKQSA